MSQQPRKDTSGDKQRTSPASSGPDKDGSAQEHEKVQKRMVQRPVYFVSSLLQEARSRYSGVQKLRFGLLLASLLGVDAGLRNLSECRRHPLFYVPC